MHIREIGHPSESSGLPGIKDRPVQGWTGIPYTPGSPTNELSYGDWYTKWLAQSSGYALDEAMNNADNYALFIMANYVQSTKGWYPSKEQVPISPVSRTGYLLAETNETSVDADNIYGSPPHYYDSYCYVQSDC